MLQQLLPYKLIAIIQNLTIKTSYREVPAAHRAWAIFWRRRRKTCAFGISSTSPRSWFHILRALNCTLLTLFTLTVIQRLPFNKLCQHRYHSSAWPSGLRRATQVRMERSAQVRTLPLTFLFLGVQVLTSLMWARCDVLLVWMFCKSTFAWCVWVQNYYFVILKYWFERSNLHLCLFSPSHCILRCWKSESRVPFSIRFFDITMIPSISHN